MLYYLDVVIRAGGSSLQTRIGLHRWLYGIWNGLLVVVSVVVLAFLTHSPYS